jgi:hypothetical protein
MADVGVFKGTINDLPGPFSSYGGSGGELGGGGIEINLSNDWLTDLNGSAITGSFGGFVGLPAEVHGFREKGTMVCKIHVSDLIPLFRKVNDLWKNVWHKNMRSSGKLEDTYFSVADPSNLDVDLTMLKDKKK